MTVRIHHVQVPTVGVVGAIFRTATKQESFDSNGGHWPTSLFSHDECEIVTFYLLTASAASCVNVDLRLHHNKARHVADGADACARGVVFKDGV